MHKPLLALLILGRIANGQRAPVTFAEVEPKLRELLADFGRPSAVNTPHNPFWHMQNDGIWQLEGPAALLARPMGATPNITELHDPAVQGSFTPELLRLLDQDPQLIHEIAHHLVEVNFPASIAQDVLVAYEYRCCVCGYDLRLGRQIVGVEAVHIRWFQFDGPDTTNNGLALCATHHKMFDLGAFTVTPQTLKILFSTLANGNDAARRQAHDFHSKPISPPQSNGDAPNTDFLKWHEEQVFKGEARK